MIREELAQLAIDVVDGKVFGSWMIRPEHLDLLERVFVPLRDGRSNLPADVSCLYEYRDRAWPLTIEGYPVFFSMKWLNQADRSILTELIESVQNYRESWKNSIIGVKIDGQEG